MQHSKGILESEHFPKLVARVRKLKEQQGGIEYMCEIMDKLMEESKEEGKKEGMDYMCEIMDKLMVESKVKGIIETLEEFGVPKEQIVDKLIKKLKITVEEALGYLAVGEVKQ